MTVEEQLTAIKHAIAKEFSSYDLSEEVIAWIASDVNDDYDFEDSDEAWTYISDNMRIYMSTKYAIDSETDDRTAYDLMCNMMEHSIDATEVGKSISEVWLKAQGYIKVDIENTDIWFYIYE